MRAAACRDWLDICRLESFDIMKLLATESDMLSWKADGLPSDSLSMQNAIVLLHFQEKCPFIIDPATSATRWLQHHLAKVVHAFGAAARRTHGLPWPHTPALRVLVFVGSSFALCRHVRALLFCVSINMALFVLLSRRSVLCCVRRTSLARWRS